MLDLIAGITAVHKLYVQLLYRCNFECQHCFHGERLQRRETFTLQETERLLVLFRQKYGASSVTFLGGEPFLHSSICEILELAKRLGYSVDICTNGYKIQVPLRRSALYLDNLRVSLEGLENTNDLIRHKGSFRAAVASLRLGAALGIRTAITMTVNRLNVHEIGPLAALAVGWGVEELKLHALRVLGNAAKHPELTIADSALQAHLQEDLLKVREQLPLQILFDEDLVPFGGRDMCRSEPIPFELQRVEVQPGGELYISCKAVGADSNAFRFDKRTGEILHQPHDQDELASQVPQVRYSHV